MKCPICSSPAHRTVDVADSGQRIRRRRSCTACRHRWTTYEAIDVGDSTTVPRSELEGILSRLNALLAKG